MASIVLKIKPKSSPAKGRKFVLEIDANKLERIAASFGLFNPDFLESLDCAEKDVKSGRVRRLRSLADIRS